MDYSKKLKDPRWQQKRVEILERDNFTCQLCGDKKTTLIVHHKEYKKCEPWDYHNDMLVTLCEDCHKKLHGFAHVPTLAEIKEYCEFEIEDGIVDRIATMDYNTRLIKQILRAGRYLR